jgi:hypothetical protein
VIGLCCLSKNQFSQDGFDLRLGRDLLNGQGGEGWTTQEGICMARISQLMRNMRAGVIS